MVSQSQHLKRNSRQRRLARHRRVRQKIFGTADCPRLSVFKSGKHFWAQIIDDNLAKTIVSLTDVSKEIRDKHQGTKQDAAFALGKALAEKAKAKGVARVVFDRGGFVYQGRVQKFADGAREGGLLF
jgi:large subunit ribosomal protein L18